MKGKLSWSLHCYFRLHAKAFIYIESFAYHIEKKIILKNKRNAIWEEIEKYDKEKGEDSKSEAILPVNTSPTNPKEKIKSKAPQTERRLSNVWKRLDVRVVSETVGKPLLKRWRNCK